MLGLLAAPWAWSQDPFEIHIYEYEPMHWGEYSLEAHLNFNAQGKTESEGSLLPTLHQPHLTLEPTLRHPANCGECPGSQAFRNMKPTAKLSDNPRAASCLCSEELAVAGPGWFRS